MDADKDQDDVFNFKPLEIPPDPMEFLSRSWSVSAMQVSKALAPPPLLPPPAAAADVAEVILEEADKDAAAAAVAGNNFSFASSATSQLVLERIMSQSEVPPLTSGRLSHSSGTLNGGSSLSDSLPVSPSDLEDVKYCRAAATAAAAALLRPHRAVGTTKTAGGWLKDRREKKKEAARAGNAQLHAAVSVAGVAAAVAAIAGATTAARGKGDWASRTDTAVASAAALVAAQCVEAAEAMGADREQLDYVVNSALSVRTPGDIVTLTAAAATTMRGAATHKARALKEVWNVAAVIPVEKGHCGRFICGELKPGDNFLGLCSQELLSRGTEVLKRTRRGALHWKLVSVYINQMGQVMLKTKSKHVAGTITKKKKSVILGVCNDVSAWPGRDLLEGGDQRCYFGLKTAEQRAIEFECRSRREHEMWTQGVSRLLSIANGGGMRSCRGWDGALRSQ